MKLTWPHVVVVGLILGAIVLLAAFDRDTTALVGLGTLLLAGLGLVAGQQLGIKDQTNGNVSELLRLVREMAVRLAEAPPPPPREQGEAVGAPEGERPSTGA